ESQRLGPLQIRVAALCTLVQICDGYDINSIGVAVPSLTHAWNLPGPAFTTAFVWSSIGILVGALSSGPIGDRVGRKPLLLASIAVFGAASLLSGFAGSLTMLAVLRFFTGLGIGGAVPGTVAPTGGYARSRQRQPDRDAVRQGLRAADRAVVGHLLLQPDEFVPVRLLDAAGLALDRAVPGRGRPRLQLPRSGRDLRRALSRLSDRPVRPGKGAGLALRRRHRLHR